MIITIITTQSWPIRTPRRKGQPQPQEGRTNPEGPTSTPRRKANSSCLFVFVLFSFVFHFSCENYNYLCFFRLFFLFLFCKFKLTIILKKTYRKKQKNTPRHPRTHTPTRHADTLNHAPTQTPTLTLPMTHTRTVYFFFFKKVFFARLKSFKSLKSLKSFKSKPSQTPRGVYSF